MSDQAATGENDDLYAELAEVDLRDLGWMPLDVNRLRDSGMAAKATGEEFMAAVILWAAAWHQVPAASLPDDDRELAKLAGYGRAVNAWQAVRTMALYGFERGPDGRLYHPVIAEKALEAVEWVSKKAKAKSGTKERVRKHREKMEKERREREAAEAGKDGQSCNTNVTRYSNDPVTPCNAPNLPDLTLPESPLTPPPSGGGKRRPRGCVLPEGWEPDEEGKALAKGLGLDVADTLVQFRDHYAGMTGSRALSADWGAWWRKWCRGAPQRHKSGGKSSPRKSDASEFVGRDEEKQWRARLNGQTPGEKTGFWPSGQWGPRPGDPGCLVPPHILKEFGFDIHTTH